MNNITIVLNLTSENPRGQANRIKFRKYPNKIKGNDTWITDVNFEDISTQEEIRTFIDSVMYVVHNKLGDNIYVFYLRVGCPVSDSIQEHRELCIEELIKLIRIVGVGEYKIKIRKGIEVAPLTYTERKIIKKNKKGPKIINQPLLTVDDELLDYTYLTDSFINEIDNDKHKSKKKKYKSHRLDITPDASKSVKSKKCLRAIKNNDIIIYEGHKGKKMKERDEKVFKRILKEMYPGSQKYMKRFRRHVLKRIIRNIMISKKDFDEMVNKRARYKVKPKNQKDKSSNTLLAGRLHNIFNDPNR